jgi:hypothetical protein
MKLRSVPLRSAALAALVLAAAGCNSASPRVAADRTAPEFRNSFLAFTHPAAWKPFVFPVGGTLHFKPMLYLSSQPAHAPCRTKASETVCTWPVDRLQPGGAVILWENGGAPNWSLSTAPGSPFRVGGRAAKRRVSRPGPCRSIGADETIDVAIERPLADNYTAFTACLKGPGLAAAERRVDALLASTRFLAP